MERARDQKRERRENPVGFVQGQIGGPSSRMQLGKIQRLHLRWAYDLPGAQAHCGPTPGRARVNGHIIARLCLIESFCNYQIKSSHVALFHWMINFLPRLCQCQIHIMHTWVEEFPSHLALLYLSRQLAIHFLKIHYSMFFFLKIHFKLNLKF